MGAGVEGASSAPTPTPPTPIQPYKAHMQGTCAELGMKDVTESTCEEACKAVGGGLNFRKVDEPTEPAKCVVGNKGDFAGMCFWNAAQVDEWPSAGRFAAICDKS